MGDSQVVFVYESTKLRLYLDNGNYCVEIQNREVADAVACLPEDAFQEFAQNFIKFYKSHYSKPGTKQARFRKWVRREIAKGRIPGPRECKEWLGHQSRFNGEHGVSLGTPYTEIRIQELKRAGFVKREGSHYWEKPN